MSKGQPKTFKFDGRFKDLYVRPCGRGIMLTRQDGEELYLGDLLESYMELVDVHIRIEGTVKRGSDGNGDP